MIKWIYNKQRNYVSWYWYYAKWEWGINFERQSIADTFNEYFGFIVESLDLYKWENEISDLSLNDSNQDYLDITIHKNEKHPSIQMVKQNFRVPKKFSFQFYYVLLWLWMLLTFR